MVDHTDNMLAAYAEKFASERDIEALQSKIEETIRRIKALEKAGYGPGKPSYDDRVRELNMLTVQRNRLEDQS